MLSGRYRLESKLGSGGMSTVYLARDETLERWVAAKVLHREISDQPDQIERFRREARAVAQVSHPNVVAVIDAGEDGGRPYIVFEYVHGETLKQRIDRLRRLPLDEAAAYAIEIGRGLAAAHARRLVHRDVKPQNVLIDSEGRAKVTDFGIARELEQDGLTATGRVLGTTDYVSPEQAMGHEVDERSDVYSLGILLYEMLTGEVPFQAENLVGVAMKHVNEPMPDVQKRAPRRLVGPRRGRRAGDREEARQALPGHERDARDLENALEVEVARAGRSTGEATTVLDSVAVRRQLVPRAASRSRGSCSCWRRRGRAADRRARGKDHTVRAAGRRRAAAERRRGRAHRRRGLRPRGRRRRAGQRDRAGDRREPGHDLANRDLHRRPRPRASGKRGVGLIVETASRSAGRADRRHHQGGWSAEVYAAAAGPPEGAWPGGASRSDRSARGRPAADHLDARAGAVLPDLVTSCPRPTGRPGRGQRSELFGAP